MNPETQIPSQTPLQVNSDVRFYHSLCWKAIFAGVVTAMGMHLLFLCLGTGIGLATFSPLQSQNPTEDFTAGTAIAWSCCAIAALFIGGWVSGCFSAGPKTATLHGIIVWSITLIITFVLVASGGGLALGGAVKALGTGLGMTGKAAGSGISDLAKAGATQGSNQVTSFIQEAVKASPTNAMPKDLERAKRELGFAVTKLFNPDSDVNASSNQTSVIQALTNYAGLSETDAKQMESEWMNSYSNLKAEFDQTKSKAEAKARETADKSARELAKAGTIAFFAFLVGLIITVCGAICGARKLYRHTTLGRVSA